MLHQPRPCCCKHHLLAKSDASFIRLYRLQVASAAAAGTAAAAVAAAACTAGRAEQLQMCLQPEASVKQKFATYHSHRRGSHSSKVLCRGGAATAGAAGSAQDPPEALSQSQAALQQLVAARGLDLDPALVAQEAHLTFEYLSTQQGALPEQVQDAVQLLNHALHLTDLMATGSTFMTLQMLKRHPALLRLSTYEVASRVLQLKLLMPAADVARLLYQKPTLLLIDDLPGVVGLALNKLHALMPGIPVESKLHEGGTVFWSFSSLIQDTCSNRAAQAHAQLAAPPAAVAPAGPPPGLAAMAASVVEFHDTMMAVQQQQQSRHPQQQHECGCAGPNAQLQQQQS